MNRALVQVSLAGMVAALLSFSAVAHGQGTILLGDDSSFDGQLFGSPQTTNLFGGGIDMYSNSVSWEDQFDFPASTNGVLIHIGTWEPSSDNAAFYTSALFGNTQFHLPPVSSFPLGLPADFFASLTLVSVSYDCRDWRHSSLALRRMARDMQFDIRNTGFSELEIERQRDDSGGEPPLPMTPLGGTSTFGTIAVMSVLDHSTVVVPEPSVITLFLGGVMTLGLVRFRKRRN